MPTIFRLPGLWRTRRTAICLSRRRVRIRLRFCATPTTTACLKYEMSTPRALLPLAAEEQAVAAEAAVVAVAHQVRRPAEPRERVEAERRVPQRKAERREQLLAGPLVLQVVRPVRGEALPEAEPQAGLQVVAVAVRRLLELQ